MFEYSIPSKTVLYVRVQCIFKNHTAWPNAVFSLKNPYCMSEYSVFLKICIVRSSALRSRNSHCATECNISFHINTTRLSVVHFHAKHYTIEYNVFFVSALCIVSFRNYVYTALPQFVKQTATKEGNCRHPILG